MVKFKYYNSGSTFNSNALSNDDIAFVEDTGSIWTHGIEFGAGYDTGSLDQLNAGTVTYTKVWSPSVLASYVTSKVPTTMVASGSSHAGGLVPDPGATQGTTKYLREDGTWAMPSGAFPVYTVSNPSGTQTLLTNSHHVFTNVGSTLTIAFGPATSGKSNIYSFEFTTGSTAPTLSLPAAVYMEDYSALDANTHYEISIRYNASEQMYYGIMQKWDVS